MTEYARLKTKIKDIVTGKYKSPAQGRTNFAYEKRAVEQNTDFNNQNLVGPPTLQQTQDKLKNSLNNFTPSTDPVVNKIKAMEIMANTAKNPILQSNATASQPVNMFAQYEEKYKDTPKTYEGYMKHIPNVTGAEKAWLEKQAEAVATSEDFQKKYDSNLEKLNIESLKRENLKKQIEEMETSGIKDHEQYLNLVNAYSKPQDIPSSIAMEQDDLLEKIEQKKYEERTKNVLENDVKARTIIEQYYAYNKNLEKGVANADEAVKVADGYDVTFSASEGKAIVENFNNLRNKGYDPDELYKYFVRTKEEEISQKRLEEIKEVTDKNPAGMSAWSTIDNAVGSIGDAGKYIGAGVTEFVTGEKQYIDTNDTAAARTQAIRGAVSEKIGENIDNETASGVAQFLYQTGMSMADFLVTLPLNFIPGIGQGLQLAVLSTSAGTSAAKEAYDNTGKASNALSTGLVAGIAETVLEKISIDELFKMFNSKDATTVVNILKNAAKQSGVEAIEEGSTNIINTMADGLINGDKSAFSIEYQEYISQGLSEDEAMQKCIASLAKQLALDAAGGALSGGVIGGGASTINYAGIKIDTKRESQEIGKEYMASEDFDVNALLSEAKASSNKKAVSIANAIEREMKKNVNYKVDPVDVGNLIKLVANSAITTETEINQPEPQNVETNVQKNTEEVKSYGFGEQHPNGVNAVDSKGNQLVIRRIESSARVYGEVDNRVKVLTTDGKIIDADELTFNLPQYNELVSAAKNFDTNGARALVAYYESYADYKNQKTNMQEYLEGFTKLYEAGRMGGTWENVKNHRSYAGYINSIGLTAAINAVYSGGNDSNTALQNEANKLVRVETREGRVYVEPNAEEDLQVDETAMQVLELLSKKTGREIILTNELGDHENGRFQGGKVYISTNLNQNYVLPVAIHECVHGIRKDSPADYAVIKGFIIDYLFANGHNVEHMVDDIKAKWGNKVASYEDCIEEIVCNAMMSITTDENAMQKALKVAHANENILDKIAQAFNNLVAKIKEYLFKFRDNKAAKIFAKDVETLEQLAEMFNEAAENAKAKTTEQKNKTASKDSVKFSLNENAKNEVHNALYNINYSEEIQLRDETPAIMLAQKGVKNLPMTMKVSHIRENVFTEKEAKQLGLRVDKHTHYHGLGETFYLQIIDELDNITEAYRGTKNADDPARREKYFLLVSKLKDENGNVVNVPIYINEKSQCNRVFIDANKISTVFGRNDFRKYIQNQIEKGNLVRIKNRSNTSSERNALIAESYRNTASNNIISQGDNTVNNNSMQENEKNLINDSDVKFSMDDIVNTDEAYMTAVNNGDMEAAQRMVDKAAKKAGYNSSILYHGTKSFGFTEFDLDKMDDKRSIFLTDSKKIASTYSGVEGIRKISENYDFDIDSLSPKSVVSKLNLLMDKLHKDDSEYAKYQFIDDEFVDKLSNTLSKDIDYLKDIVSKKKKEYKNDGKIYSQLSGLLSKLDNQEYTNLSTPIYMLLHHTNVFEKENKDKIADIEKNIRLFNKIRFIDVSDGIILRDMLDGYSLDILYNTEAKEDLEALTLQGNYSMYGNLEGAMTIDAKGAYWNNIKNWFSNIKLDYENTKVARENDEFFYLIDKRIGEAIPESWLDVNEHTKNMTENQLQTLMLNKANESLRFKTENIRTTRDIAKFAEDHGYNGVVFKNLADNGGQNSSVENDELSNVYIFFSSSQIKSADPVTYDDDGNIIPLSERFKVEQSDIRYSIDDSFNDWLDDAVPQGIDFDKVLEINPTVALATVYRSAAKTTESGLAQSKGVDLDDKAFLSIARKIMQRYEIKHKNNPEYAQELAELLKKFTKAVENGEYDNFAEFFEEFVEECRGGILLSGDFDKTVMKDEREFVTSLIHGKTLLIRNRDILQVEEDYGSISRYRKLLFGKTNVALEKNSSGKGYYIEDIIEEVADNYPYLLNENADGDMGYMWLENLVNKTLKPKYVNKYIDGETAYYENPETAAIEMAFNCAAEIIDAKAKQLVLNDKADKKQIRELAKARKEAEQQKIDLLKAKNAQFKQAAEAEHKMRMEQIEALRNRMENVTEADRRIKKRLRDRIKSLQDENKNSKAVIANGMWTIREEYNEGREKSKYIHSLGRMLDRLSKRLDGKAKNGEYIPDALKKPILDVLGCFTAQPVSIADGKKKKRATPGYFGEWKHLAEIGERVQDLEKAYKTLKKDPKKTDQQYSFIDVESLSYKEEVMEDLSHLSSLLKGHNIYTLSASELREIYETMSFLERSLKEAVEIIVDGQRVNIAKLAEEAINDVNDVHFKKDVDSFDDVKKNILASIPKELRNSFIATHLDPVRYGKFLSGYKENSIVYKLFSDLHSGDVKRTKIMQNAFAPVQKVLSRYTKEMRGLQRDDVTKFNFNDLDTGKRVKISQATLIAIYLTDKQTAGRRHLLGKNPKGIVKPTHCTVVPDLDYSNSKKSAVIENLIPNGKVKEKQHRVRFSENDLQEIAKYVEGNRMLLQLANAISSVYNEYLNHQINEVSMAKYGMKIATVKDYYPLRVWQDGATFEKNFEAEFYDERLKNRGFTKQRETSSSPIMINDVLESFSGQVQAVSEYCGLLIPIENFKKVYNVGIEGMTSTHTLHKAILDKFGHNAEHYIDKLMGDLQKPADNIDTTFIDRMQSKFMGAKIIANPGAMLKQFAAYPLANRYFGAANVAKAFASGTRKVDLEKYSEYTPYLWYRKEGNGTVVGEVSREQGLARKGLGWLDFVGKMDNRVVGSLLYAAELHVEQTTNLKKGSDDFYKEVVRQFENCIDETQPNNMVTSKPQYLRNKNLKRLSLNAFRSQNMAIGNTMIDSFMEFSARQYEYKLNSNEETKAARDGAAKKFASCCIAACESSIMIGILTTAINMLLWHKRDKYKDEEGNISPEKIFWDFISETFNSLSGTFAFFDYLYQAIEAAITGDNFYGLQVMGVENISNAISNAIDGDWWSVIMLLGDCFGIPADNLYRMGKSIYLYGKNAIYGPVFNDKGKLNTTHLNFYILEAKKKGDTGKAELYEKMWKEVLVNEQGKTEGEAVDHIKEKLVTALATDDNVEDAAVAKANGELEDYEGYRQKAVDYGFDSKDVQRAIDKSLKNIISEIEANGLEDEAEIKAQLIEEGFNEQGAEYVLRQMTKSEKESTLTSSFEETSGEDELVMYDYSDAFEALVSGDSDSYEQIESYLIEQGGKKKSEIKSAMRSESRTDKLWEEYIEASTVTNDLERTKELVDQLTRIYGTWGQAQVALRKYRKRMAEQEQ